jgi:hypothetical protein
LAASGKTFSRVEPESTWSPICFNGKFGNLILVSPIYWNFEPGKKNKIDTQTGSNPQGPFT